MQLGFSHAVTVKAPDDIAFEVPQPTQIVVSGSRSSGRRDRRPDPQWRPPEPYKGKASATRAST
jgi:large subunit ribosomal protein L6